MSSIKYFKSILPIVKTSGGVALKCENAVFRLHNKFTVGLLLGCSMLLGASEFLGKPINCLTSLPKNAINQYCWISSTFTMDDYFYRESGSQSAHPGVRPPDGYDDEAIQEKWRFHNYYQWVVFFLAFQAFLCYLPKYIWKIWEGTLMKTLSSSLIPGFYKDNDTNANTRKNVLIHYLMSHLKMHNGYVFKYFTCELLCFVNIVSQMFLIDRFLEGEFLTYGLKVLEFSDMDQEDRMDPMIYIFPRMTKCIFHLFGASGTIERRDSLCILAQNILNEKIFIFMWFWYVILAILLGGLVVYRALLLFLPALRPRILYYHNKVVPIESYHVILRRANIGDWWILYCLCKTLDQHVYKNIVMRVAKEIETYESNNGFQSEGGTNNRNQPEKKVYPNPSVASAPPSGYSQSAV